MSDTSNTPKPAKAGDTKLDSEDIANEESISQIYDKVFKRILTLSNVAVINFINGIFNKNYPKDSKLTYNWTENIKNSLEKTIADTIITVNDTEKYHIEAHIKNDSTVALRVFDYGYQDALKYKKTETDRIILDFPQSKIIFLEHNNNTPDEVVLKINFGEQGGFEYKIPAMKFLNYSIDELNEQHLVILMPLYLLKLRKEIKKEPTKENALKLKALINEGIIKSIEDNENARNITHEDAIILIGLLEKLYSHLYGNIKKFKEEGVKDMIADKLILETDIILFEAEERAKEREEKAKMEIARKMIADGEPIDKIVRYTNLTRESIDGLMVLA